MNLDAIQSALREAKLDGWLFFDHQERDPLAYRVLGLKGGHVSRRWYYWVPASGANELPLPWGEGRGEGEGTVRIHPRCRNLIGDPNHSVEFPLYSRRRTP